jgi:hypothetical protein
MADATNRKTVERVIQALNTRDLDLFHAQFHDDSVMEYPQSGERIVGEANRRAVYGAFPGLPKVTPKEIRESGELVVVEATLDYGDGTPWQAVFLFELRDAKIARETAYWPQPFDAADWRAEWVERIEA